MLLLKTLIIGCMLMLVPETAGAGEKVLLVTGECPPYTTESQKGYGFYTEIVTAVFKEAGLEVEYKFKPWLRNEADVKNGSAYAVFPYIVTDEREKAFDFSEPLLMATQRFFYIKNRITSEVTWKQYEDLKPFKIGGTFGYWYPPVFKAAGLTVDLSADDRHGIRKLYYGRFDLFAADELNGWELIKEIYPNKAHTFRTTHQILKTDGYRLMISRTYPNAKSIAKRFKAAFLRTRESGLYSEIFKRHNIAARYEAKP